MARLLDSDCIEVCSVKPICMSPIHCVPKENNKLRLVTDLRVLNSSCQVPKYRNEDIRNTVSCVQPQDYFVTTEIKDGFFHIPVAIESRDYLGFKFQNKYYRWNVLVLVVARIFSIIL